MDTWREHLNQLESVSLSRRDLSIAFSWSLFNWIADVACLAFAAYAAGGKPSLAGLTVAYAAARAVGSIPLMPGGLLVVEAVLVPGLVSSGMTLASAISAMLIYRLVSWIFIAAIGWVVFFFMFRTEKDVDPDAALDEPATRFLGAPHAAQNTHRRRSSGRAHPDDSRVLTCRAFSRHDTIPLCRSTFHATSGSCGIHAGPRKAWSLPQYLCPPPTARPISPTSWS